MSSGILDSTLDPMRGGSVAFEALNVKMENLKFKP